MGTWQLEIFKMSLYMAFPVTMFHYFNQPGNYEHWVNKVREEYYPKENKEHRRLIEESIKLHNQKIEEKELELMQQAIKKNNL
ncbi:PREDICTED: protein PET100 homolog, mitochondrial [Polistes dominula]|uniref:Protein PET100 homolog, mitochondrial n=1 Tax=Polistes dominula TaxID=743375 RepID=A0ABM1I321_POLDO|nr:PREDICTED: protein PET100 homolog, mitochondrial [Polistes dominula]XP_015174607.1 PREDICTED: protein PET100 homolog, mitochondrial [Polistes dominula]XP_015174608.1 PREDICTED: protein PET100 homolog, mitochondrial [Polistes dominula]